MFAFTDLYRFLTTYSLDDTPLQKGQSADVFLASRIDDAGMDLGSSKAYVAKVFHPPSDKARGAPLDFLTEFGFLSNADHPNIMKCYGAFQLNDVKSGFQRNALLLQYLPRGDIAEVVRASGKFYEEKAQDVAYDIFSALAYVHSKGVVHRDVKAENILVGNDGCAVLCDFGIAVRMDDVHGLGRRVGSDGYAAPEVFLGLPVTDKADVFGLGITLFFCMTRQVPLEYTSQKAVTREGTKSFEESQTAKRLFKRLSLAGSHWMAAFSRRDASQRPTARESLCSTWLAGEGALPVEA